jgi:hypothetical protein
MFFGLFSRKTVAQPDPNQLEGRLALTHLGNVLVQAALLSPIA